MTNKKSIHRRVHTFKKAYNTAKSFLKGADGDPFLITQARHYKALAQAWALGQREKDMVSSLVIP
jgi:hypothetical protein